MAYDSAPLSSVASWAWLTQAADNIAFLASAATVAKHHHGMQRGDPMKTYNIPVTRDGKCWMIDAEREAAREAERKAAA